MKRMETKESFTLNPQLEKSHIEIADIHKEKSFYEVQIAELIKHNTKMDEEHNNTNSTIEKQKTELELVKSTYIIKQQKK